MKTLFNSETGCQVINALLRLSSLSEFSELPRKGFRIDKRSQSSPSPGPIPFGKQLSPSEEMISQAIVIEVVSQLKLLGEKKIIQKLLEGAESLGDADAGSASSAFGTSSYSDSFSGSSDDTTTVANAGGALGDVGGDIKA